MINLDIYFIKMAKHIKSYYKRIFFEALVNESNKKTILILPGFPFSGVNKEIMDFLFKKGYNVFFMFYPGTYQSKGIFLEESPVEEIKELISYLKNGEIISLWDDSIKKFNSSKFFLFGGSFSGPICFSLAEDENIDKIFLSSPVVDFSKHNLNENEQDLEHLTNFVKKAYKNLFRFNFENIVERMSKFRECSPLEYLERIKTPIFISHDPNDQTVSINHIKELIKLKPEIKLKEHSLNHSEKVIQSIWEDLEGFLNESNS